MLLPLRKAMPCVQGFPRTLAQTPRPPAPPTSLRSLYPSRDTIKIMATEDTGISLAWFLVGAAVGATVALLYAPQSGRETRRLISKKTEQGRDAIADSSKE